jgi:hypothetical protein
MDDAADDAPVVRSLDAAHTLRRYFEITRYRVRHLFIQAIIINRLGNVDAWTGEQGFQFLFDRIDE